MLLNKNKGFTLIEVLVAVAILGLVATGSLRLMIMSSQSLSEVESTRELLNMAREVQLNYMTKETEPTRGSKGNYRWETRDGSWPILDGQWELKYKQLRVETENNEIIIYMSTF